MELLISHELVSHLISIEKTLATLPKSADYAAFYKKQARDIQITDVLTLAESMELSISPDDAREILDSHNQRTTQPQLRLLRNCISVMKYAKTVRENTFTSAVLQQENKLLTDGFSDFWEEGKVRSAHESTTLTHDGLRNRPTQPEFQLWIDIRQLLSYTNDKINPLLLAGITSYHLISSYPFLQFNLQTALLNAFTITRQSRYWALGTTSVMAALWKTLQRTDFTFDPSPQHFTAFVEKMTKEYKTQIETIHDALVHRSSIAPRIRASLNDRQLKILTYFKQHKKLTRKKYASMMSIGIATAFRDLNDLTQKCLIKSVGKGRGTSYVIEQLPSPEDSEKSED
ncbi:hypothetical protein IT418_03030 [bacterium]|nr:hypothetical protein [bacterium]